MKIKYSIVLLLALMFGSTLAQEPAPLPTPTAEPPKKIEVVQENQGVILIVNSDNMNRVLVVTDSGKWLFDARKITIVSDWVNGVDTTVECLMYRGLYEPPNPELKTWTLTGIINASESEFQKILADLQDGSYNNTVN